MKGVTNMSYIHCPYCEVKEASKVKTIFEAIQPIDGKCPDCGAYIDAGQHKVTINGYADIYNGVLKIIGDVVGIFEEILSFCDINLDDYFEDKVHISMYTSDLLYSLFAPYTGGTTKSNLAKALGINESENRWFIQANESE